MNVFSSFAQLVLAVLVQAAIQTPAPVASAKPLDIGAFAYDAAMPLDEKQISLHTDGGVRVQDISFASAIRGKVHAEVVGPADPKGRRGAVLFVHWLGDPATTNLHEFYPDAVYLARQGCVSLLIDAAWAQPHWYDKIRSPKTDYVDSIHQVIDLRRSLDVLVRQPGVDPHHIAFVGHDFGAMYGAVLSGVDPRPRWYVLMAGNPSFSGWFLFFPKEPQPENMATYLAQISRLDPPLYLARSHAEEFLFQFSSKDFYIPMDRARAFANAAPLPRGVFFYDTDHSLHVPAASTDRLAWLRQRLTP